MAEVTAEFLRLVLDYDPDTGEFTWKVRCGRQAAGSRAGAKSVRGAIVIGLRNKDRMAHRLAFLWMTGETPVEVDHINNDPTDNRWCNLRPCTSAQNKHNTRIRKHNRSGYKGVYFHAGRWEAACKLDRKKHYLGRFDTPEEAHAAYVAKARELHGEFARAG